MFALVSRSAFFGLVCNFHYGMTLALFFILFSSLFLAPFFIYTTEQCLAQNPRMCQLQKSSHLLRSTNDKCFSFYKVKCHLYSTNLYCTANEIRKYFQHRTLKEMLYIYLSKHVTLSSMQDKRQISKNISLCITSNHLCRSGKAKSHLKSQSETPISGYTEALHRILRSYPENLNSLEHYLSC